MDTLGSGAYNGVHASDETCVDAVPSDSRAALLSTPPEGRSVMRDAVFAAIVVAFFVAAALYVRGCAALVGTAPEPLVEGAPDAASDETTGEVTA